MRPHDDTGYPIVKFDSLWFATLEPQRFAKLGASLGVGDLKSVEKLANCDPD
jgi:hypothetical protein